MLSICCVLWREEAGFLVSSELVLVSTIGVMGLVAGLSEVSQNLNGELHDVGSAVGHLDQSYAYQLANGAGSSYQDAVPSAGHASLGLY